MLVINDNVELLVIIIKYQTYNETELGNRKILNDNNKCTMYLF